MKESERNVRRFSEAGRINVDVISQSLKCTNTGTSVFSFQSRKKFRRGL
jgi:hypothetical protein